MHNRTCHKCGDPWTPSGVAAGRASDRNSQSPQAAGQAASSAKQAAAAAANKGKEPTGAAATAAEQRAQAVVRSMAQLLEEHEAERAAAAAKAGGTAGAANSSPAKASAMQLPATTSVGASGTQTAKDKTKESKEVMLARLAELDRQIAATEGLSDAMLAPVLAAWKHERDVIKAGLKGSKPVHLRLREATSGRDKVVVAVRSIQYELEKLNQFAALRTSQLKQLEVDLVAKEQEVNRLLLEQQSEHAALLAAGVPAPSTPPALSGAAAAVMAKSPLKLAEEFDAALAVTPELQMRFRLFMTATASPDAGPTPAPLQQRWPAIAKCPPTVPPTASVPWGLNPAALVAAGASVDALVAAGAAVVPVAVVGAGAPPPSPYVEGFAEVVSEAEDEEISDPIEAKAAEPPASYFEELAAAYVRGSATPQLTPEQLAEAALQNNVGRLAEAAFVPFEKKLTRWDPYGAGARGGSRRSERSRSHGSVKEEDAVTAASRNSDDSKRAKVVVAAEGVDPMLVQEAEEAMHAAMAASRAALADPSRQ